MSPKNSDAELGLEVRNKDRGSIDNDDLIPDAGKVVLEEAQPWGRGFVADFKRTVGTHWVEEMINFNQKTVAVSLLMFITVIAPTLTFGALYGENTENHIGAVETIIATSWVGIAFSLFCGMPTCIAGSTGPVLIMTTVIYEMSKNMDIPFLPFYAWVSVWVCIYTSITAFFDLTRYVRLATRFTDDIFAFLIVSIFILNAIGSPFNDKGLLRYLSPDHATHEDYEGDEDYSFLETSLLSVILGFATTCTIFFFRGFKMSTFFCNQGIRDSMSDFAVIASVLLWSLIQNLCFESVEVPGLKVPEEFEPTYACCSADCTTFWPDQCEGQAEPYGTRSWFANMSDLNGKGYAPIMAAGPALLAFVLVYLDNGITWHLIYNKENGLQHGESYNYELFLNGLCNMINGLLGLPWLVATTVPCIVHLNNLADKNKDGKIISVQETRLTHLFSHAMVGLSLLFLKLLKLIPFPVLLGVFLFMGLASMGGIQFWQRILLFFMQPGLYPETPYTKYVSKPRIHLFTALQIMFFCGVFVVQNTKAIAIIFPFMTLLCIPGRLFLLGKIFKGWELLLLDGEEDKIKEWIELKEGADRHATLTGGAGDNSGKKFEPNEEYHTTLRTVNDLDEGSDDDGAHPTGTYAGTGNHSDDGASGSAGGANDIALRTGAQFVAAADNYYSTMNKAESDTDGGMKSYGAPNITVEQGATNANGVAPHTTLEPYNDIEDLDTSDKAFPGSHPTTIKVGSDVEDGMLKSDYGAPTHPILGVGFNIEESEADHHNAPTHPGSGKVEDGPEINRTFPTATPKVGNLLENAGPGPGGATITHAATMRTPVDDRDDFVVASATTFGDAYDSTVRVGSDVENGSEAGYVSA